MKNTTNNAKANEAMIKAKANKEIPETIKKYFEKFVDDSIKNYLNDTTNTYKTLALKFVCSLYSEPLEESIEMICDFMIPNITKANYNTTMYSLESLFNKYIMKTSNEEIQKLLEDISKAYIDFKNCIKNMSDAEINEYIKLNQKSLSKEPFISFIMDESQKDGLIIRDIFFDNAPASAPTTAPTPTNAPAPTAPTNTTTPAPASTAPTNAPAPTAPTNAPASAPTNTTTPAPASTPVLVNHSDELINIFKTTKNDKLWDTMISYLTNNGLIISVGNDEYTILADRETYKGIFPQRKRNHHQYLADNNFCSIFDYMDDLVYNIDYFIKHGEVISY